MALDLTSIENFQDAMVTVMGLGRYKQGSGVGAAKWLMRHGAQIVITDLKDQEELCESVDEITKWYTQYKTEYSDRDIYQPVFVLGEHQEDDFTNVDLVVQNPGVARESEFVQLAKEHDVHVESDISLFFRYCPFPIVSITGTRGKSTTTALLGEMLKSVHEKTVVAGNITRSPLEDLDWVLQEKEPVPIVLELSSWLLESLEGSGRGPQIGILTNAYKDHLDRYDSFEHYIQAKELIFKEQSEEKVAILNYDQEMMHDIAKRIPSKHQYWFSGVPLPSDVYGVFREGDDLIRRIDGEEEVVFGHVHDLKLEGEHNIMNALPAALAAHLFGAKDDGIHQALKVFAGLPGRQEVLGEHEGILFVNDTTATSPEGVMAALARFGKGGNVILLAGGSSKGFDFKELSVLVEEHCKHVTLFEGSATDQMEEELKHAAPIVRVDSMSGAFDEAMKHASLGDIVLLSPGTSSFGMFKNEFDRGDQFENAYRKLSGKKDAVEV